MNNRGKRKEMMHQNKKAWVRIVEAFIAIMLIMTILLVVITRQKVGVNTVEEVRTLQRNILNLISTDDNLRNQILSGNLSGTNDKIKYLVPAGYNYSIRLCPIEDICALGFNVPGDIYSQETLLVANLTYITKNLSSDLIKAQKLKLFFWLGPYPESASVPNYDVITVTYGPAVPVVPPVVAPGMAVLIASYSNLKRNYGTKPACAAGNDVWYYYDMIITETSGQAGATLASRQRCYYTIKTGLPWSSCDSLSTSMPTGMPSLISAGQIITVNNRWFCIASGYVYNVTETFYNNSVGTNILVSYNITNIN